MNRDEYIASVLKYDGIFNPYQSKYGDPNSTRISIDIPSDVHLLLRNVTIDKGFFQRALAMFIYTMADHCTTNNIQFYSPLNAKELYDFVRSRCTLAGTTPAGHRNDDARPVEDASARTPSSGQQCAVTKSRARQKRTKSSES